MTTIRTRHPKSGSESIARAGERLNRLGGTGGLLLTIAVALYGMSGSANREVAILVFVYSLLGLGLYLPLALTRQVSLAYAAYFGIGAYGYGWFAANGVGDPLLGLLVAVLSAAALAFLVAFATTRLAGYFLAVTTLLVGIAFQRLTIQADGITGGPAGLGFERLLAGVELSPTKVLITGGVLVFLAAMAVSALRASRLGGNLLLMSEARPAAEALGINTVQARAVALTIGAAVAALGGVLFAANTGFVVPESFGVEVAFLLLFVPILGGISTPWGAVVGAAVVAYFLEVLHTFGPGRLLFGLAVLAVVLFLPGGVLTITQRGVKRGLGVLRLGGGPTVDGPRKQAHRESVGNPEQSSATEGIGRRAISAPPSGKVLEVSAIAKNFGGVQALEDVTFHVEAGEIVGVIGPNGAGKSTLVDIITGHQDQTRGTVRFAGHDLVQSPSQRARLGLCRTFQHPLVCGELTVIENVALGITRAGAPQTWGGMFSWFLRAMIGRDHSRHQDLADFPSLAAAQGFTRLVGSDVDKRLFDVSYGVEKLTEVGRALAADPMVLLMDEPFAGLDQDSAEWVIQAVASWSAGDHAVVVVDHNVDLLRKMCHRLVALNQGVVIANGHPDEVLADSTVRIAYFGESR